MASSLTRPGSRDAQDPLGEDHARILRKIAADDAEDLEDLATLADPSVVTELMRARREQ